MDVLSVPTSVSSFPIISATLSRHVTAQLSHRANRHFLNKSASSAPPLESPSGITGRGGGVSSPGPARICFCFGVSSETPDNDPGSLRLRWKLKEARGGGAAFTSVGE